MPTLQGSNCSRRHLLPHPANLEPLQDLNAVKEEWGEEACSQPDQLAYYRQTRLKEHGQNNQDKKKKKKNR